MVIISQRNGKVKVSILTDSVPPLVLAWCAAPDISQGKFADKGGGRGEERQKRADRFFIYVYVLYVSGLDLYKLSLTQFTRFYLILFHDSFTRSVLN